MRDIIKDMLAYLLLIAIGVFLLLLFGLIAINGEFSVHGLGLYEPCPVILIAELLLSAAILGFGIERLHNFIKKFKKKED